MTTGLTPAEKTAGRAFRDTAQTALTASFDTDPPTFTVPNILGLYRHLCPNRQQRSTALECVEVYWRSPAYPHQQVPEHRFGFIFRQGVCRHCGATARSATGRLVDAHTRPPIGRDTTIR